MSTSGERLNPRDINLSDPRWLPGPKATARGLRTAVSTDNPVVTHTLLNILEAGGNAVDAAIAGCLLQGTIEPYMTNHAGSISFLMYEAATGQFHQLDSTGTYPPGLPLHKPIPPQKSGYAAGAVHSCLPGFMPGLKELHSRFASLPWDLLCEEAIFWAETGNHVSQFEFEATAAAGDIFTYFPEGRQFFYREHGYFPRVGERFSKPELARTLRNLAEQGPDYMISGAWAEDFVRSANRLGWKVSLEHMSSTSPRWVDPLRFSIRDTEIVALAPPQQQGLQIALALGILDKLGIDQYRPYSAEHLYFMAHTLRLTNMLVGYVHDPVIAPADPCLFTDPIWHDYWARFLHSHMPRYDLTEHMHLTATGSVASNTGIVGFEKAPAADVPRAGSCELSIVDSAGNWVQMMNTLQGGGIPGMVVGGVPMIGNHSSTNSFRMMDVKLVPGARQRLIMGHTMLLRDGRPYMQLGTPGSPPNTQAQALCNILFYGMEPYEAFARPRMYALMDDMTLAVEDRLEKSVMERLFAMGINVRLNPPWDWHMGSFQCCYIDPDSDGLCATVDPRRAGHAGGLK